MNSEISGFLKPGRGSAAELLVLWNERVLACERLPNQRRVSIGGEAAEISVPGWGFHPSVQVELTSAGLNVRLPPNAMTKLIRETEAIFISDGDLFLSQGEMLRLDLPESPVSLLLGYRLENEKPKTLPLFDFASDEMTGVTLAGTLVSMMALFMSLHAPSIERISTEEPQNRVAKVIFKTPVPVAEPVIVTAAPAPAEAPTPAPKATRPRPPRSPHLAAKTPKPGQSGLLEAFNPSKIQSSLSDDLIAAAATSKGHGGKAENGSVFETALKGMSPGANSGTTVGLGELQTNGRRNGNTGYRTGGIGRKGSAKINIQGQEAEFTGTVDKEAIRKVIQSHIREIRYCYERELQQQPDLNGKISVRWNIDSAGRALNPQIASDELGSLAVGNCIRGKIKEWNFPATPLGVEAEVKYPFVFSAK